ncbi:hypothetical protein CEXT_314221 [Caerostris extrusa]|uniref:Uncharacterized protein n=1 Tax=Caerostris extrusa TaxID=172846 RepID=A0AAV4XH23_CAEEX|nr:hypothetical protein CEXT_314221 [Caerostris extrusa]
MLPFKINNGVARSLFSSFTEALLFLPTPPLHFQKQPLTPTPSPKTVELNEGRDRLSGEKKSSHRFQWSREGANPTDAPPSWSGDVHSRLGEKQKQTLIRSDIPIIKCSTSFEGLWTF